MGALYSWLERLMAYMQWALHMETGIQVIDAQHRRIVDYINELDHASTTDNADELRQILVKLVDYTITHFQFEEALLERANYPFLKAHKKVHDIFRKRIAALRERAIHGESVIPELVSILTLWLSSHIQGDDRDFVDLVKTVIDADNHEHAGWLSTTLHRILGAQPPVSGSHA
jgi:hemerythrin